MKKQKYSEMKKQLIILALLFGLLTTLEAQTMIIPKREVRAVWLTTLKNLDWPRTPGRDSYSIARQKQELRNILDKYQKANINTVLLQAVDRASVIYPSAIYPWDACMSGRFGVNPGYDPLAFAVAECHKRGMEVQAWIATLPVGPYAGTAAKRLRDKGYKMFKLDGDAFLDPSQESTAELIASVAREITTHYDIDGIHLDYIRYPEMLPAPRNAYVAQWRRDKITDIVRKVHDAVKAEKPWVRISCSPIGKYSDLSRYSSNNWNARDRVSQDAQLWLRLGLMDQLYPMIYFRGTNFYPFAADWSENSCGRAVAAGLGTYFLDRQNGGNNTWSLEDIAREMMVSRRMGLGTAHFRSRYFTENVKEIYDFSSLVYAPYPALVPAIKEDGGNGPKKPASLLVHSGELVIGQSGPRQLYNVYGSDRWPVDITDARNLLLTRYASNVIRLPSGVAWQPRYYAVTTIDRYGNESEAVQSWQQPEPIHGQLLCDGYSVRVETAPLLGLSRGKDHILVKNPQGQLVRRLAVMDFGKDGCDTNEKYIDFDVSGLSEGVYRLSLASCYSKKKTITRDLGCFMIRR